MLHYRDYPMDIDFDDGAAAWRANKRRKGESFAYICGFVHPNGRRCNRDAARGTALDLRNVICAGEIPLCRQHLMLEENRLRKIETCGGAPFLDNPPPASSVE